MRRSFFSLFWCTMLFLVTFSIVNAQDNNIYKWLHQSPQGNTLRWVRMWDANNWYAAGYGATFMKTSNAGTTWTIQNNIWLDASDGYELVYDAYFINMNTGWMSGNSGKIIKTTDGGVTWDTNGSAVSSSATWYGLYFLDANTGFAAGTSSGRVAMTTDGGATWNQVGTPPSATYYNVYAKDVNNIIATSTSGNIRRTTDGGTTWSTVLTGTSSTLYRVNFLNNGDTGYVCGSSSAIRYTTDFGATWTQTNTGVASSTFYDIDFNGGNVYITGNAFNIYESPILQDNFDTVQFLNNSQPWTSTFYATSLSQSGDTVLTVGASGLIQGRFSPSNRVAFTSFVKAGSLYDIWGDSATGRVIAVGSPGIAGSVFDQVMYSTNNGEDWSIGNFSATADEDLNSISMVNSMTGFVAGDEGGVHRTTDGGATWTELTATGTTTELEKAVFFNASTGYVFGDDGNNYSTTDGGTTWNNYTWGGGTGDVYGAHFLDFNTGWVCGASGDIYMTTNGGANTTAQDPGVGTSIVYDIYMHDANTGWCTSTSGRVRKTTNGGTTWDTVDVPFSTTCYSVQFYDDMTGYVTGTVGHIFRTTDGGTTWLSENTSASTVYQSYSSASNRTYVCGTDANIWQYFEIISGTGITFTNNIPERHYLEQNYPNPFNPSTTIKFGLPIAGNVSLKIYDMSGREVANLINNERMNAGIVSYNFNGSSLSSGVYFYSLVVDNNLISTKKMVLVK